MRGKFRGGYVNFIKKYNEQLFIICVGIFVLTLTGLVLLSLTNIGVNNSYGNLLGCISCVSMIMCVAIPAIGNLSC